VLELFARVARPASRADQWQFSLTAGYSRPERSLDGEVASWKAVGPVRLLAAARGYGDLDGRGTRAALLGGVLVPLAPGRIPLALAGDIGVVLGDGETSRPLWSIGLHTGLASTPFTIAFQASNARDPGFQGAAVEAEDIHFGVAVMSPIPVGGILGWLAPREQAERAVHGGADPAQPMALARISRHAYWPSRLEIEAGTTVEWVNDDVAHHSITAVDASFDSGILGGGEVWRARFNEPGTYLYQCGPHPYMQGVVVVSPRPRGSRTRGGTPASVERPSDHQRGSPLRGRP
jgi:plastocyanin